MAQQKKENRGRKQLSKTRRLAIRGRLQAHIKADTGAQWPRKEFLRRVGCADTTLTGWLDHSDPATPDLPWLVKLMEGENLSLEWLLLGKGPRMRESLPADETLPARLRAQVLSEAMRTGVPETVAETVIPEQDDLLREVLDQYQAMAYGANVNPGGVLFRAKDPKLEEELECQIKAIAGDISRMQNTYTGLERLLFKAVANRLAREKAHD